MARRGKTMFPTRSVDIHDVLTRLGIAHRRSGRELVALCPFHSERTPSWSIRSDGSEKHGLFRCKGSCREPDDRGSLLCLISRVLNLRREDGSLDRAAARRWLFGAEGAPPEPPPTAVVLEVDEEAQTGFRLPAGVVVRPADEWSSQPLSYLVEDREVSRAQIDRWGLGYAFTGKLAGRVVMPVRDAAGRVLSYSARTFIGDRLKWRSADRSDRPDPNAVFGEAMWPSVGRTSVVVVEAALDALAVEAALGESACVAAIHGSESTDSHIVKLATFSEVVVAADPDEAGEKIHLAIKASLSRWTRVRRARLPDGHDASKLWREDPGALRRALAG